MLTYFKRYRMCYSIEHLSEFDLSLPNNIRMLAWREDLLRSHARTKHESFRHELDATVFPCLAQADGCLKLMNDIRQRDNFLPEATILAMAVCSTTGTLSPIGTIQGMRNDGHEGAIQNIGIIPERRGQGLGAALLQHSLHGFALAGCKRVVLEVTTFNTAAIRLYERIGFKIEKTLFKAADVPGL
jgi:[ribosomal protein S18]-alanine N-acetyltransferase